MMRYSTTCVCDISSKGLPRTRGRRRLLMRVLQEDEEKDEEEEVETILMDLVSTSEYIGSEFVDTFTAADDFNSVEDLRRVLIVILMFAVLVGCGDFSSYSGVFGGASAWYRPTRRTKRHLSGRRRQPRYLAPPQPCASTLRTTSLKSFPLPFSNKPFLTRMVNEVKRHHRYLHSGHCSAR